MILFLLLNIPALFLAIGITRRFFNYLDALGRILCVGLFYFSYIVLCQQVLGIFGVLTIQNLYLINAASLLLAFLLRGKAKCVCLKGELYNLIQAAPENKFILFFVAAISAFTLVKIALNLFNAPFGWDSLNYHFTFAVEWLKQANLDMPIVIGDNPCPSYFPINGSLVYLWFIFPFKSVYLADLGQVPFFIITFLCIYRLCRRNGVGQEYSFFASLLMTVTPNYFKQMNIAYVDIMVCAWFMLALNFLLDLEENFSLKNTVLFSLSCGLLAGTKTIALNFSFILVLFFLYILFRKRSGIKGLYAFAIFIILAAIMGGFAYIRNFLETGNPLYPFTFQALGKVIFPGVLDKANFTAFSKAQDYSISNILFHEGMGVGPILFIIPGLVVFIYSFFKRKSIPLSDSMLVSCFVFFFIIYRYVFSLPNVRYIYPMFAIGYVLAFMALSRIDFPLKISRWLVLVCVIAALPEMARKSELAASMGLTFTLFFVLLFIYKSLKKNILKLVMALSVIFLIVLGLGSSYYNKNEFKSYIKMTKLSGFWPDAAKAWDWLNENTVGNNVAYVGRPVPFPLYGTNFKNNVYYVSVNKTDPVKLHYFSNGHYKWQEDFLSVHKSFEEKGNYRADADYAVWLTNLKRRGSDYLFVYSLHQTKETLFPLEDNWAKGHPDKFQPAFSNDTIHIYKVLK